MLVTCCGSLTYLSMAIWLDFYFQVHNATDFFKIRRVLYWRGVLRVLLSSRHNLVLFAWDRSVLLRQLNVWFFFWGVFCLCRYYCVVCACGPECSIRPIFESNGFLCSTSQTTDANATSNKTGNNASLRLNPDSLQTPLM